MANHRTNSLPICWVLVAQGLLGTLGVFVLEANVASEQAVFWRCLFGAVFLTIFCYLAGYFQTAAWSRRSMTLAIVGGLCMVLNWVLFFEAIRITWIGFATIAYHVQPFWIVLAGIILMKEELSLAQLGWITLAFTGFLLALDAPDQLRLEDPELWAGAGLAVAASLLYTVTIFTTRSLGGALKPHIVAWVHTVTGVLILAPFASVPEPGQATFQWAWLIGLGVIHTGVVYVLLYDALPKLASSLIAVLMFAYPATAVLVDWLLYGHELDRVQCLGLILIGLGTLGVSGAVSRPSGKEARPRARVGPK